jgi:two-component system cell cycle response regulator
MSGEEGPLRGPLRRVLIVDDSRMVRASIIKNIRERYEFREEADGEAGWQALLVDPSIQLVISDIGMPQLDGYGLLARIRASHLTRIQELPVVIISGEEDGEAREKARQLGANDFITKGIGTAELLARLESLSQLGETRRQLEASRLAHQAQVPKDPVSGLATKAYLDARGEQDLALARRHQGHISAMVIEIDRYDELLARYGAHVLQLINRKLSNILSTRVRREDTVAELAPGRVAVLSPSTDIDGCCAFALRLSRAIEKLVLTYREERIRISVTAGVAGSAEPEAAASVDQMIAIAMDRARAGQAAGGNRVMARAGEVGEELVQRLLRTTVSVDQALAQLRAAPAEVRGRLRDVVHTLLPLLEFIETESRCGIPLASLQRYVREADGDQASENATGR